MHNIQALINKYTKNYFDIYFFILFLICSYTFFLF
ncbi:hypothetical protein CLOL250_00602 [Clostridium sp. L2-50]|nr:hypothetical protein CLOL250_00602 [Clostridium sp. L2-50]